MRKILIMILIVILLIIGYFMIMDGMEVFGVEILSFMGMKQKNEQLDLKLQLATSLTSTEYPSAIQELNTSSKQLVKEKSNYADLVTFSSSEEIAKASQFEKYEMEYLWTKIGNHATKNGVVLKLDVKTSSTGTPNQYDLYYTATGKYVSISEFITALENDSSLNFKVENFKLLPSQVATSTTEASAQDTTTLQATFVTKDVAINIDKISNTGTSTTTQQNDGAPNTPQDNTGTNSTTSGQNTISQ